MDRPICELCFNEEKSVTHFCVCVQNWVIYQKNYNRITKHFKISLKYNIQKKGLHYSRDSPSESFYCNGSTDNLYITTKVGLGGIKTTSTFLEYCLLQIFTFKKKMYEIFS